MQTYLTPGIHVEEIPTRPAAIEEADATTAALVGPCGQGPDAPTGLSSLVDFESQYGAAADSSLGVMVGDFFENGGHKAVAVRASADLPLPDLLGEAPDFALLVVHRDVRGDVAPLHELCQDRLALLVIEAEVDGQMPAGLGGHAAVYHPDIVTRTGIRSPCASVAGVIVRTDVMRGTWKAPAGPDAVINGATGLAEPLDSTGIGTLTLRNVNALRVLPGGTVAVWGARTASEDPEWKYVTVRRMMSLLERSLRGGLQWVAFEPNDEPLWARVRDLVEVFLIGLWRRGGLQGSTSREAYFVRCDRSTMTQDDIDRGRLVVLVGAATIRPSEFLTLRLDLSTAES